MPKIARWDSLPANVRQHLIDRLRDRSISIADLNQLRVWIESQPEVPPGDWYKDFGSFKICGRGSYPKTFLLASQTATAPLFDSRRFSKSLNNMVGFLRLTTWNSAGR